MAEPIDVSSIISSISSTDLGKHMLEVIATSGKFPKITQSPFSDGTSGEYDPRTNSIQIDPALDMTGWGGKSSYPRSAQVIAHELTHAADEVMSEAIYGDKAKLPKHTKDQLIKFREFTANKAVGDLIKAKGHTEYRARGAETKAFGVGNTVGSRLGNYPTNPVSHVDATKAQEFAIQADLFLRGLKQMSGTK